VNCETIQRAARNKGTGINCDSIDTLIALTKLNDHMINRNLQNLFNMIYQGHIPPAACHFFTDTYLFCLHKDPNDETKLRPIGIPTAMRRIMTTHIAQQWKDKFALHLLPYNFAVGIPNGMDFIIKSMHLSIEKFINSPQQNNLTPSRAAIFVDLTNMFNAVSRTELFDIINKDFPELSPLTSLFYAEEGNVLFKWKNKRWKNLHMKEGVNQGCPLSPIFATLVLHRVLKPLAKKLEECAANRLANGDPGDDGFGGLAHLSSNLPHKDVLFFCEEIERLGASRGCFVNPQKTRILTSCSGESILTLLHTNKPHIATEIETALATYSVKKNPDDTFSPVELKSGFRLLGTPIGSPHFSKEYYDEQLATVKSALQSHTTSITDLHTRLKLFSNCTIQKLPHLLDSDIMHNLPPDFNNECWYNWNGHLTNGINNQLYHPIVPTINPRYHPTPPNILNAHYPPQHQRWRTRNFKCKPPGCFRLRYQHGLLHSANKPQLHHQQRYLPNHPAHLNRRPVPHKLQYFFQLPTTLPPTSPIHSSNPERTNLPTTKLNTPLQKQHLPTQRQRQNQITFRIRHDITNLHNDEHRKRHRHPLTPKHPVTTNIIPTNWNVMEHRATQTPKLGLPNSPSPEITFTYL